MSKIVLIKPFTVDLYSWISCMLMSISCFTQNVTVFKVIVTMFFFLKFFFSFFSQYNLVNILQSSGLKVSMIFVCYLGKYNFPRASGRTNIFTRILFLYFFKYQMKINSFLSLGVIRHIHFGKVTISHLNCTGSARWPVLFVFTLIVLELYLKNEVFGVSV